MAVRTGGDGTFEVFSLSFLDKPHVDAGMTPLATDADPGSDSRSDLIEGLLVTDPATLEPGGFDIGPILGLYEKYHEELRALSQEISECRRRMVDSGYSTDFSDREGELLYMLLREIEPDAVVEISPCHGYSTCHIMLALERNGRGRLYSYEIMESVGDRRIEDVISGNLPPRVDRTRLEIIVGDASGKQIPACDFAFIDSCHEAWFSAFYFREVLSRTRYALIHDIIIELNGVIVPKAAFLGVRENLHCLESLFLNGQKFLPVAAYGNNRRLVSTFTNTLVARYPGRRDLSRSILVRGHRQSGEAMALHEVQEKLIGFYIDGLRGDRLGPLGFAEQIVSGDWPPFAKICAALTLPFLGYRRPAIKEFSGIHGTVRALASEVATVAQFLACLEYGFKTCDYEIMYTAKKSAHKNGIDKKPINILWADYHERKLSAKFMYKITGLAKNMFSR